MVIEPACCDSDAPERWLSAQREQLHRQLGCDHTGRTQPYVIGPDRRIHTRSGKQWAARAWAVLSDEPHPRSAGGWRIVRTVSSAAAPAQRAGQLVVPVHHRIDAADDLVAEAARPRIEHLDRIIRSRVVRRHRERDAARIPEPTAVAPTCLDDLPDPRRRWFLTELARHGVTDRAAAEQVLLGHTKRWRCRWRHITTVVDPLVAVLGDDGRYHLQVGDRLVCAEWSTLDSEPWEPTTHRELLQWWSDGTQFQLYAPRQDRSEQQRSWEQEASEVDWTVALTATTAEPFDIPPTRRCATREARQWWPAHHNPKDQRGRLARLLAGNLGYRCGACRFAPAMVIDHDHETGLVRGLLCRNCNCHLEGCVHVSGCPFAEYLNNPPAAALALRYPGNRAIQSGRLGSVFLGHPAAQQ